MSSKKLSELPVVDAAGVPLGLVDITDVLQLVDNDQEDTALPAAPLSESHVSLARSA